jgi:hypothetical protein
MTVKGTGRDWSRADRVSWKREEGRVTGGNMEFKRTGAGGGVGAVLVEGECWEDGATFNRVGEVLHDLGFPPLGLRRLVPHVLVTVTEDVSATDYLPSYAAHGNVMRRLCREGNDLASYEEAVLDKGDSASEASMDLSD